MKTIKELRQEGYKVRVTHYRYKQLTKEQLNKREPLPRLETLFTLRQTGYNTQIWPKGGTTIIEISSPDGRTVRAEAICSLKDSYKKSLGVQIALNRCFKLLEQGISFKKRMGEIFQFTQRKVNRFLSGAD